MGKIPCKIFSRHLWSIGLLALTFFAYSSPALAQKVQLTHLNDMNFGTWTTTTTQEISDTVCVYRNKGTKRYRVTATGVGSGGAFAVASGSYTLAYRVFWGGVTGTLTQLTANVPAAFSNADQSGATCPNGDNIKIAIRFLGNALAAARPGSYSGTITLLIEPN